jgi:hypothetical protein
MIVEEPRLPCRDLVAPVAVFLGVIRVHISDKGMRRVGWNIKIPPHHSQNAVLSFGLHRPRLNRFICKLWGSRIA